MLQLSPIDAKMRVLARTLLVLLFVAIAAGKQASGPVGTAVDSSLGPGTYA